MTTDGPAFATIFRSGQEAWVRALAEDIARHHPGCTLHALYVGHPAQGMTIDSRDPGIAVRRLEDLGIDSGVALRLWLGAPPGPLTVGLAPRLAGHLLEPDSDRPVVLLAVDTAIRAPIPATTPGIALVERFRGLPPADGRTPPAEGLAGMTIFDDGFLMAAGDDARQVLRGMNPEIGDGDIDGYATWVRRWDALAAHPCATVLDDPRIGVAYWNIAERTRDGGIMPGGVITARLCGLDPEKPHMLSDQQGPRPRVLLSEHPGIRAMVAERAGRLRALSVTPIYSPESLGSLVIDDAVRAAYRRALGEESQGEAGLPDLLAPDAEEALTEWLRAAAPGTRERAVSRYVLGVWDTNAYAHTAFPNPLDDHAAHLVTWVRQGRETLGVPLMFVPPPPAADGGGHSTAGRMEPGVNVIGFLRAGFGIGEATRLLVRALEADDIPHAAISVSHGDLADMVDGEHDGDIRFDTNLICVNVDWLDVLTRRFGPDLLTSRYSIGTWWWESNVLPPVLAERLPRFDELWVGSNYIAESLAAYTDRPIRVFPLPIPVPPVPEARSRSELGLPDGFLFMFSFDFNSTVERKNPEGVIEAFVRAFPEPGDARLVIKTINGGRHLDELERLRALTCAREDILIVDGFLPADMRDAWTQACDCYVSLHRCEGFGLTMAEAMAMGKPVIATGYSANLDFMTPDVAVLIDHVPWPLDRPAGPYPMGTVWADPDVGQAAEAMRRIAGDPGAARELGARAREHIGETRTVDRLARFVRQRLEEIRQVEHQVRPIDDTDPLPPALQDALGYDAGRRAAAGGGVSGVVNRAIRPYTAWADETTRRILVADIDAAHRVRAIERRVDSLEAANRDLHAVMQNQQSGINDVQRKRDTLEARVRHDQEDLEGRLYPDIYLADPAALTVRGDDGIVRMGFDASGEVDADRRYADFEDMFRGPRERVVDGLRPYAGILAGHGPVLDVGCGRGEMLELLAAHGIEATGIDIDPGMVERCAAAGLPATRAEACEYLAGLGGDVLGAVFSAQVIEHIPWDALTTFLRESARVLRPGGLFIAETVNPHCLQSLKAFWIDPTHQHPIFPESCLVYCRQAGFSRAHVLFSSDTGDPGRDRRMSHSYAVVAEA